MHVLKVKFLYLEEQSGSRSPEEVTVPSLLGSSGSGFYDPENLTLIAVFAPQGEISAGWGLHHTQELCHIQCIYWVHITHPIVLCTQKTTGHIVGAQQVSVELDGKGLLFTMQSLVF